MEYKVFVYGTLKTGFPNVQHNQGVPLEGRFQTKLNYPLLLVGERYSPWMLLEPDADIPVIGQVFCLDEDGLAQMDKLERITQSDGYRRVEIDVIHLESEQSLRVFTYGKPADMALCADVRKVLDGEYLLEHAALYSSRC